MSTKKYFFLLLIIFSLATFLRLYRLTDFPPGLMQDEAVAGYDAFSLLTNGRDHHGIFLPITFNSFNDWVSPFFIYYLVPFVQILGLNAFAVRFSVAFLSLISMVIFYFVSREFFPEKSKAIIAVLLFAFSSYAISTSRWAIPTHTIILPLLLFLLFFLQGLNREKKRIFNFVMAQFFLGVAVYTDTAMKLFGPILALFILIFLRKIFRVKYLYLVILFAVFSATSSLTYLDHLLNFSALNNRFNMISVFSLSSFWPLAFVQNYFSYLLPFGLFLPGEVNPVRATPGFGYEHLVYGIFFYTGLFVLLKNLSNSRYSMDLIKKQENNKEKFLLLYYFLSPLPVSLTLPASDFQRALYILPAIILMATVGFAFIVKTAGEYLAQKLSYPLLFAKRVGTLFLVLLIFINLTVWSVKYFGQEYQNTNKFYFQFGLDQVFSYLSQNKNKYQQINITNVINMPYIYYLFYTKYDPKKLIYDDYKNVDKNGWTKVDKIGKYNFIAIDQKDLKGTKLLQEVENSPITKYQIWEKGTKLFVVIVKNEL